MDARGIDRVLGRFEAVPCVPGSCDVEILGILRTLVRSPCAGGETVLVEPEPCGLTPAVGDMVRQCGIGRIPCHAFGSFVRIGFVIEAPELVVKP